MSARQTRLELQGPFLTWFRVHDSFAAAGRGSEGSLSRAASIIGQEWPLVIVVVIVVIIVIVAVIMLFQHLAADLAGGVSYSMDVGVNRTFPHSEG